MGVDAQARSRNQPLQQQITPKCQERNPASSRSDSCPAGIHAEQHLLGLRYDPSLHTSEHHTVMRINSIIMLLYCLSGKLAQLTQLFIQGCIQPDLPRQQAKHQDIHQCRNNMMCCQPYCPTRLSKLSAPLLPCCSCISYQSQTLCQYSSHAKSP